MSPPSLLGPPQLHQSTTKPSSSSSSSSGDAFIDSIVADFNKLTKPSSTNPSKGLTENNSATFLSSGNPCLDLFFHVVPDTPATYLHSQLPLAWLHHPLTTLKLICNLRGVRGTGKSDKESFYTAALWLHSHHPKTLACNLPSLADFGYFKDLPEIIYRLLQGADVRQEQKSEWQKRKHSVVSSCDSSPSPRRAKSSRTGRFGSNRNETKEARKPDAVQRLKSDRENVSAMRHQKTMEMAKKAIERYSRDSDYRFLYDRVSELFAECLKSDVENLRNEEYKKISLAAKWCPSTDSSFDRATLLCESIARSLFPRESNPEYEGVEEAHYVYRIRDRLREEILVPLRKVLELPEVYIGANAWSNIPYNRVASLAMKIYKDKFFKHDEERFKKYLEDVQAGKSTIAAGAVLPHEIIASLSGGDDDGQVGELQWKRMVEDMVKLGKMKNCLAVCDVSGSMCGEPMEVSVALGLLVSELSDEPWKGKVITFSADPELHLIEGESLKSKTNFIRRMKWGMNTDFEKVFDLILKVAVKGNLKPEDMIKRIFVFSDMEFDQASTSSNWETDYEVIQKKYMKKGYGNAVPQIVFWNLRDSRATPIPETQPGVALLSGFSKNLLKLFLDNDGEIRPDTMMELAISGPEYQKLLVLD